jgi:6-phosphogluconolactonase
MKITRRVFASLLALRAAALALVPAQSRDTPITRKNYLAFVGTYTTKTASKGIYLFHYDANSGKLAAMRVAAETPDPSWIAIHPHGKFLYAANEAGKNSMVSAFAIDSSTGNLRLLNQLPALGEDPCYLSFDKTGKYLFVANYTSGNVVVFPIGADGKLGPATANVHDDGKLGPNKQRQEAPHAHWVRQWVRNASSSASHTSVYVADLGLDRVLWYGFDPTKGTLTAGPLRSKLSHQLLDKSAKLAAGTGPRHAVFSSTGERMYVLGELQSTVTAFHMMGRDDFVPMSFQEISALPRGLSGRNDAAEIAIHPNGKFLYASNRGHDSIALLHIDPASGKLTAAGDYPVEGKEPRHFAIDPSGNYLLAEDQLSDKIVSFRIDQETGALRPTGDSVGIPSPVCLAFLPLD